MKKIVVPILLTFCVFLTHRSNAQSFDTISRAPEKKWHFLIEPYIMIPNMKGTSGMGSLPDIEVDANPDDIFSNLQIGAMLSTEASIDKWHISTDVIYMNIKQDVEPRFTIIDGELNAKQFALNLTGLYSITPWLDLGAGGMLNSLILESDLKIGDNGTQTQNRERKSETWFDPMIVARTQNKQGAKFIYQIRADIGGFGIGSNFTYQFQFYAGYRFSKLVQLTGGYRVIGIDYEKHNSAEGVLNNNRFLYDMSTFGPVIKLGFNL